jgi:hypothetical protein
LHYGNGLRVLLEPGDSFSVVFVGRSTVTLRQEADGRWHWRWSEERSRASISLHPGEVVTVIYGDRETTVGLADDGRYLFTTINPIPEWQSDC